MLNFCKLPQVASYLRLSLPILFALLPYAVDAAFAQESKKSAPQSLPPSMTANAIHATAFITLMPMQNVPSLLSRSAIEPATAPREVSDKFSTCKADSVVCYDLRQQQARLPIAKELMPALPGMKKESLSIRRDKLSLQYSF
jgi:hypothetical protein